MTSLKLYLGWTLFLLCFFPLMYKIGYDEHARALKETAKIPKTYCQSLGTKEKYVAQDGTDYVCFTEDINTKRITKSLIVIQTP